MSRGALAAIAVALALPLSAAAHEVLHSVERGRAVAVRVWFADGEPLAYCEYEVFSPVDPATPHQKGRTDRAGWLAFVPDAPGTWRAKVVDATGHGAEIAVESAAPAAPGPAAPSTLGFVLRPLLGVLVIAAVFAALFALRRRRSRA